MKRLFKPVKQTMTFEDYVQTTLAIARRIVEIAPGKQRFSSAQLELALISFADLEALQNEMDLDIEVQFPHHLEKDWFAGFDWLDLSVSYGDQDAINYFQDHLDKKNFYSRYLDYKNLRPDCALQNYEHLSLLLSH